MDEQNIYEIIKRYPYPIAILYRIIAGMDLAEEPDKGLFYILQTAEAIARLTGMITLGELVLHKENEEIEISNIILADFKKSIKRPSFGIWLGFAREGIEFLKAQKVEITVPELKNLFYEGRRETEFKASMDKLIKLRNAIAHQKVKLDNAKKKFSAIQIALNYLNRALMHLDFLGEVSFGYIGTIEVTKKRRQPPFFVHKGKSLKGDSIGKGINLNSRLDNFRDTDAVIIRYDEDRYLNLYPFYIYDESSGDSADIFFYNGMKKNTLEYIGIDPGGKFLVEDRQPESKLNVDEEFEFLISGGRGGGASKTRNIKFNKELHAEFNHIIALLS